MLTYRTISRKSPKDQSLKYYPMLVSPKPIFSDQIISRIERRCTLASADVKAVTDAIEVELMDNLAEGKSVRLGDLGTFRLTLRTKGSATPEEVTADKIVGSHIVFTPSPKLRRALSVRNKTLKFTKQMAPGSQAAETASPGIGG